MAVLNLGSLEQLGTPEDLYVRPATRFVAGFVGRASSVSGTWRGDGGVAIAAGASEAVWQGVANRDVATGAEVELVFRPETLEFVAPESGLPVRLLERRYAGSQTFFTVESEAGDRFEVIDSSPVAEQAGALAVAPRPSSAPPRVFAKDAT